MRVLVTAVSLIFAVVCASWAAPEPAIVPGPGLWTVDVAFTPLQAIVLRTGPENKPVRFWYSLVTISNNTRRDVGLYPKCDLMTDTFHVTAAGKGVSGAVFEQIKLRHQGRYPLLESLEQSDSRLLQGEDNAKDVAIIWPDFDGRAKNVKVFISGLSNETIAIDHPVAKDEEGRAVKVFLRKTLELDYAVKGDAAARSDADLSLEGKRWIMR